MTAPGGPGHPPNQPNQTNTELLDSLIRDTLPASQNTLRETLKPFLHDFTQAYLTARSPPETPYQGTREHAWTRANETTSGMHNHLDAVLHHLYPTGPRSRQAQFITHLDHLNLRYAKATRDTLTIEEEAFARLRYTLLDLAQLDPQPLNIQEVDPEYFALDPESPTTTTQMYEESLQRIQHLIENGRQAMWESNQSFLLDVTEVDTEFSRTWLAVKNIIATHFYDACTYIQVKDDFYAANDEHQLRITLYSPALNTSDKTPEADEVLRLQVEFFPTGKLTIQTSSFAILGGEHIGETWILGPAPEEHGLPLEPTAIKAHTQLLLRVARIQDTHIQTHDCVDAAGTWRGPTDTTANASRQ